ncbi:MAG TPA: cation-transporting P-type ATPase [Candidatus Acidoferrales bacterium]|nr:cation-transporting P-type ATPase [Candidatus Acidoferrales bacterium]
MIQVVPEDNGLTTVEAENRLAAYGRNTLHRPHTVRFVSIVREEITEPMILLLFAVGFFYAIGGELSDTITIFAIIAALIFAEVWNEYRAKKTIASLSQLAAPTARVLRDGVPSSVEASWIVPGDVLLVASGTRVAADSRVTQSLSLAVDESSLTGESFPQDRQAGDDIYAGTLVVAGEGTATAFATGSATKIGAISARAQEIKEPKTPLQLAMKSLAKSLVGVAVAFSVAIPFLGFLRGQDLYQMFLTGLALAFATIPEELPIIITMVLGLGAYQLSRSGFLIKKIKAAEVLGDATVILTDKTGTITENKMRVVSVFPEAAEGSVLAAAVGALPEFPTSATDVAILERAETAETLKADALVRERSFDSERKTRATVRVSDGEIRLFVSGAPEEVFARATDDASSFEQALKNETAKGRRAIAVAEKRLTPAASDLPFSQLETELTLVGLLFLEDPPREEVKATIERARSAGIRTIMVTGDHPLTARFVAQSVGIDGSTMMTGDELDRLSERQLQDVVKTVAVFARTTPEHKYRLVSALQRNQEIVAVTGDGINDTLALKGADIGIAMGIKGTDAAKEASDIVLSNDDFVLIGRGVFEGRKFFENLRKGVKFYLSVKMALILIFLLPVLLGVAFPFAPIQIIVLELFMDLGASAAFVAEPAEALIYSERPRNLKERFINSALLKGIAASGLSLFAGVTISYFYALSLHVSLVQAQTFAFAAWIFTLMLLAFVSRSEKDPLYHLGVFANKAMNVWAVAAVVFLLVAIGTPELSAYFKLSSITIAQLLTVFVISFVCASWQEWAKVLRFAVSSERRSLAT